MTMKLWCAIVGAKENVFSIKIDPSDDVYDLKVAIKEKERLRTVDASQLDLFLARSSDGSWLRWVVDHSPVAAAEAIVKTNRRLRVQDTIEEVLSDTPAMGPEQIHVLVVVPSPPPPPIVAAEPMWLAAGEIASGDSMKGVRAKVHRLAGSHLGFYDPSRRVGDTNVAFWYQDNGSLCIHALFMSKTDALQFDNALRDETMLTMSPLYKHTVQIQTTRVIAPPDNLLVRIFSSDYVPGETESAGSASDGSVATSVVELHSDAFRYQRLEHEAVFGGMMQADSCHVMPREQCRKSRLYRAYDANTSNRLALSVLMRAWYEGSNSPVPLMNISVASVSEEPVEADRYEVQLIIHAFNDMFAQQILARLKEDAVVLEDPLQMQTHVLVEDPKVFCECVSWRYSQIMAAWDDFLDMTPAVE